jgi:large subunit ribosomal protein L10
MPTAEKAQNIEQAKEWYSKASGVIFADYRGLQVKEMQALRNDLRKKGGEIHVIKNTLFRLAAGADTEKLPEELHNGTTAFAFVYENESDVAKALLDYARTNKKLIVKGGFFAGRALTGKEVEQLGQLPPRDVLISQVIGAIAAPLTSLVGVIEALYADPIRVIAAVQDKVEKESGAPASKPTADAAPTPSAEASRVAEAEPEQPEQPAETPAEAPETTPSETEENQA